MANDDGAHEAKSADDEEVTFVAPFAGGVLRITGTLTVIPAGMDHDPDEDATQKDGDPA